MKPEGSKVNYQELAERFYTLDTEVYEASGSELGKVFPGPKHISDQNQLIFQLFCILTLEILQNLLYRNMLWSRKTVADMRNFLSVMSICATI